MLTAVVFLLILTSAVVIHELAHFLNAKMVGLPVRAFSVGMGPILWRKRWRDTEWRLSLLPIGGYVDIPGMAAREAEDGTLEHPTDGFAAKPLPQRLWVLVGGVLANFVLAVALLAAVILSDPLIRIDVAGLQVPRVSEIAAVSEGSRAAELGLEPGDRIVAINGLAEPPVAEVIRTVQSAEGLELTVARGDERLSFVTDWPPADVETPVLGVSLREVPLTLPPPPGLPQAVGESARFFLRFVPEAVGSFVRGFGAAFSGRQSQDVAGPVQLVGITSQAARAGLVPVLFLAALINFSLAVFNLLPIPGLDGGRMLLTTVIALRGRPFRPGQEEFIHFLGIVVILAFMVLITFNEVSGLFSRS